MKKSSKWRQPQNEDDLKMETTSKWRRPQNEDDLKMKKTSKWRWPQNEDNLKMKTTSKWRRPWKWTQHNNSRPYPARAYTTLVVFVLDKNLFSIIHARPFTWVWNTNYDNRPAQQSSPSLKLQNEGKWIISVIKIKSKTISSFCLCFFKKARNIGPSEHRYFWCLKSTYVPRVLYSELFKKSSEQRTLGT